MASNAFANAAAAVSAGYTEIVLDRGAGYVPSSSRFLVTLEIMLVGQPGNAGQLWQAFGEGVSQAAAEGVATNAVNAKRANRYGSDSAGANAGTLGVAPSTPSTAGQVVTLVSLTKDKH